MVSHEIWIHVSKIADVFTCHGSESHEICLHVSKIDDPFSVALGTVYTVTSLLHSLLEHGFGYNTGQGWILKCIDYIEK